MMMMKQRGRLAAMVVAGAAVALLLVVAATASTATTTTTASKDAGHQASDAHHHQHEHGDAVHSHQHTDHGDAAHGEAGHGDAGHGDVEHHHHHHGDDGHHHDHGDAEHHQHHHGDDGHHHDHGDAEHHQHHHGDDGHRHDHDDGHHHHDDGHHHGAAKSSGVSWDTWMQALGSTFLISALPAAMLYVVPVDMSSPATSSLLKVLLAFASGGLLGDAILHLIPHAKEGHDHHHHDHHHHHHDHHHHDHDDHGHHGHDHTGDVVSGLYILSGIFVFLIIEKIVRGIKGGHGHSHSHSHSHDPVARKKKDDDAPAPQHDTQEIKVAGFLNLAADAAHNFTDGLAIGACFVSSPASAYATVVTILLHEVPHEVGDFAILVRSGYSKTKAIMLQLVTAVGAMLGTVCGLMSSEMTGVTNFILLFTAGGFIYIATVSVIPELLEETRLWQSVKELLAMALGVAIMVVIVFFE